MDVCVLLSFLFLFLSNHLLYPPAIIPMLSLVGLSTFSLRLSGSLFVLHGCCSSLVEYVVSPGFRRVVS